jgi:N-carbamoyl-L-amino-acid hydrolase
MCGIPRWVDVGLDRAGDQHTEHEQRKKAAKHLGPRCYSLQTMRMRIPNALAACLIAVSAAAFGAAKTAQPTADEGRIQQHITELSKFGANPQGGVSRVAFSDADIAGREYIRKQMQDAGLAVSVDAAGTIIGRREGKNS